MFTLVIAVLGFYISKVIEERYSDVKQILKDTTLAKDNAEKYNQQITDALAGKSNELYEGFRNNHIASIIANLEESVENIETYHSELMKNLKYVEYDEIYKLFLKSLKIQNEIIVAKYLHLLLLINTEMSLVNGLFLGVLNSCAAEISKYPFTSVQLKDILTNCVDISCHKKIKVGIDRLLEFLLRSYDYQIFETCLRNIEEKERNQLLKKLLEFNIHIFDTYIAKLKPIYSSDEDCFSNELAVIALMEQFKLELTPEDEKPFE